MHRAFTPAAVSGWRGASAAGAGRRDARATMGGRARRLNDPPSGARPFQRRRTAKKITRLSFASFRAVLQEAEASTCACHQVQGCGNDAPDGGARPSGQDKLGLDTGSVEGRKGRSEVNEAIGDLRVGREVYDELLDRLRAVGEPSYGQALRQLAPPTRFEFEEMIAPPGRNDTYVAITGDPGEDDPGPVRYTIRVFAFYSRDDGTEFVDMKMIGLPGEGEDRSFRRFATMAQAIETAREYALFMASLP